MQWIKKTQEQANYIKVSMTSSDSLLKVINDIHDYSKIEAGKIELEKNTGLGLSICKGIVEKMKGEIWAESKQGEGSNFYFTCVLEKSDSSEEEDNTSLSAVFNVEASTKEDGMKLLIVQDDAVSRMVVEKLARKKGWQVILAENGQEAVDAYRKYTWSMKKIKLQEGFPLFI